MFTSILKFLKPLHARARSNEQPRSKIVTQPEQTLTREETIAQRSKKMAAETTILNEGK